MNKSNFFYDCEALMMQTMPQEQTQAFTDFDKVCKRQDSGEMLMMIYSMSQQGCSIEAVDAADGQQLDADVEMDKEVLRTGEKQQTAAASCAFSRQLSPLTTPHSLPSFILSAQA